MPVLTVEHAFKLMALLISFFSSGQPTHNGLKFYPHVFSRAFLIASNALFAVQGTVLQSLFSSQKIIRRSLNHIDNIK